MKTKESLIRLYIVYFLVLLLGGGIIGQIQAIMPLNPTGPASINNWFKTNAEYQVIQGEGECREIDSSVFDEASKQ